MQFDYDVVVIGAGPAGEGAAMKLTKEGKKLRSLMRVAKSVVTVLMSARFLLKPYGKPFLISCVISVIPCLGALAN